MAVSQNWCIGQNNQLPWHQKSDLAYFRNITKGKTVIMGRKTFLSLGKPLPNRTNIVVTRQKDFNVPEGCVVVSSLKKAIDICPKDEESFIIGGGQIYKQSIDNADKIELTRVHTTIDADTFFPEITDF